ncbi:helix-turn-helix domain-containing protein [Mesorhizobium marinum]|uniref:helix-turn-helix domain-containing protein n=1 Tax=Mesorhizobium marinum TaxID=3228790 RepID=UPI00346782BB
MTASEISLSNQHAAMVALNEQRKRMRLEVLDLEQISGVSASAYFAWMAPIRSARHARSPSFLCLVAIAETLGFQVIMRHANGAESFVTTPTAVMTVVNAERRARRWTFADCGRKSGVSEATYYPLARGKRDPRLSTMVAISAALDFELILVSLN